MKQTNLSLAGITFGIFLTTGTWFRYFVLFPDFDKALFFGLIGLTIIAISWNYAGRIELDEKIDKIEQTLTSVEEWLVDKNYNETEKERDEKD